MMKLLFRILWIFSFQAKCSLSQTGGDKVAYESQIQTEIRCDITGAELGVSWLDTTEGTVQMFAYFQGQANPFNQSTDFKHNNFDYAFVEGSHFNLLVNDVERSDGGHYDCVKILDGGSPITTNYQLFVEVPVTPVISAHSSVIDDPFEVTVGNEYNLTCSAVGARSVNPLQLMFGFEADGSGTVSDVDVDSGLANYTKTVTYTPDEDDKGLTSLECSITGYNVITEDENDVSHTIGLIVQYRPDCTLIETPSENTCTVVTLTCSCDAVPAVAESDYYFYQDGSLIPGTSGNTTAATVEENGPTAFSCYARNAIGVGDPANTSEDYLCEPSCMDDSCQNGGTCRDNPAGSRGGYTCECAEFYIGDDCETETDTTMSTVEPTSSPTAFASTEETNSSPDKCESCAGHVAGLAVEAVLIAILAGTVGWLVYRNRKISSEKYDRTTDPGDGCTSASNSAYMDLHERNPVGKSHGLSSEIPVANVEMVSTLPGRGSMIYQRAILSTNTGNRNAVVKSLSEDASLSLEKAWSSEIATLQSLSKQATVVEILGWCNSVPCMLLLEHITGGSLREHLTENFSSQKVHQYGNTKQKRFQVQETGRVENLPKYALDVAKGLKFLLGNEFIHPGLRAQKVLVDLSGRCKIYDFVSISHAKELTKLLWAQSAPYQWMSPEFLLLDSVAAPGDVSSFGVLMWEIFSYGSQPYLGKDRSDVEVCIRGEERLVMPQNCPGAVWQLMIRCWDQSTVTRPEIGEVASRLAAMCNEDKEYDEIPTPRTEV